MVRLGCLIVLLGCGPVVVAEDPAGEDGETEAVPSTGSTSPGTTLDSTSTTSTRPPDTTSSSGDDSTGCFTGCGDDSGQDSASFLIPCDAAGFGLTHCQPPDSTCDPWEQDCPEGEKCQPWANDGGPDWTSTRCSPLDPSAGQPGDPCVLEGSAVSGVDTCGVGSLCWASDPETVEGTCVQMCTGSPDLPVCDDPQRACAMTNEGTVTVCLMACDPLVGDCLEGEGCYPLAGDETVPMFVCAPTGNGMTVGGRHPTHCAAGTVDVGTDALSSCAPNADPCCATLCDLTAPACDDGLTCTPFYEEGTLPPDLEEIGLCLG
jgi:hypothetical protein